MIAYSDDWDRYTDYRGYDREDEVIQWFWAILRGWPSEKKLRLLQFTTGTSRIPVAGFKVRFLSLFLHVRSVSQSCVRIYKALMDRGVSLSKNLVTRPNYQKAIHALTASICPRIPITMLWSRNSHSLSKKQWVSLKNRASVNFPPLSSFSHIVAF